MGELKKEYRAVRLRLKPNKTAKQRIDAIIDASRFTWNHFLDEQRRDWNYYLKGQKIPWCSASLKKTEAQKLLRSLFAVCKAAKEKKDAAGGVFRSSERRP